MSKKETLTGKAILAKKDEKTTAKLIEDALFIEVQIADLQAKIKELQKQKKPIEDLFDSLIKPGERIVTDIGTARKDISNSYSVKPERYKELKDLYKRKIAEFVTEKISYGVTPALRKILTDESYEHGDTVRNAVLIEQRTSIKFEPNKN